MGAYVPWYLADMELDLGTEAVRDFLIAHGGRQFVLPVRLPEAERGTPKAWLREHLGTGNVTLPLGPVALRTRQIYTTWRLSLGGMSVQAIAARVFATTRTVEYYRARLRKRGLLPATSNQLQKDNLT